MDASLKTSNLRIKIKAKSESELLRVLKEHFSIEVERNQKDIIPYEETTIYKEIKENRIGKRLKALRRKSSMSQEQLAEITGIQQSHISEIENGKRKVGTINTAKKIANAFGVNHKLLV